MILHYVIEDTSVALGVAWSWRLPLRVEQTLGISLRITANFDCGNVGLVWNHGSFPSQQLFEATSVGSFICYRLIKKLLLLRYAASRVDR